MASRGGPASGGQRPPAPEMGNQLIVMMAFLFAMFVMFDNNLRLALGNVVGMGLNPLVGFNAREPVLTLLFTGLLMSFFSIVVRHLFMDWVEMARHSKIYSHFQKELREARLSNNTYKLKKLNELHPHMMQKQMKASQTQIKLMPVTMLVVIPIFAWLSNFIYINVSATTATTFSVPWAFNADMKQTIIIMPDWVLLYSVLTLPFSQVLTRVLKYFSFSKKLRNMEKKRFELAPLERA